MYAEGGWERSPEPPRRTPRLTKRAERVFLWLAAGNLLLLLAAPIGGATIVHAIMALFAHR